jgi:hypothetical protein
MQPPINSTEHKSPSPWDADFKLMNEDPTSVIDAEIIEHQPFVDADIKRPVHKSPPLKMLVLFSGSAIIVAGIAFAFFGSAFRGGEQQTVKKTTPAVANTLSTSEQERLANAEAANVMGGNSKAFEAHNNQDKKEDPAQKPATETPKPPVIEPPKSSPPVVVATKPQELQPVPKPKALTPVAYQQPAPKVIPTASVIQPVKAASNNNQDARIKSLESKIDKLVTTKPVIDQSFSKPAVTTPVVNQQPRVPQALPKVIPTASVVQPAKAASNNNQDARIKSLESKIDNLAIALEKQNAQQNQIKTLDKPTTVAIAPVKEPAPVKTAQTEKPQKEITPLPQPQIQQVVQTTSPAIDGRATAKLFDPVTVSSNSPQISVRTQLTQPIPTSSGMEIPAGAIVAMDISVASNGMVTGSSTGVWDVRTQKQLNIPAGALVVEGLKGEPLIARSIKLNDGGAQDADTQAAIWGAVGAGVDGLTRPDTNSSITTGTIVTTATSGGSRDPLVNAAGGFAKSKANSLEKEAAKRRDKLSAQAEMWHLPRNTEVIISTRPMPVAGNTHIQTSNIIGGQSQPNTYQTLPQPPIPVVNSRYSQGNQSQADVSPSAAPPIPARYAVNKR